MEGLLAWLAGLPPLAVYAVIGLLAAVENVFPPFPADTAVALGAFLSHRGVTEPWIVFAVTLVSNSAGAMGMYFLGARHAPALLRSRVGRMLLPEQGLAFVRKEYERFGVVGLFVGRLLPGFRAVVPPFAGLCHLGPVRTAIAVVLASALWYGGIVLLASQFGAHFEQILRVIGSLNRGLGLVAFALLLGAGIWLWRRRRARREPDGD